METGDLFKNAKFGDRFRTKGGRLAIFLSKCEFPKDEHYPIIMKVEDQEYDEAYSKEGLYEIGSSSPLDIVGHWEIKSDGHILKKYKVMKQLEKEFSYLGRTAKVDFISKNIQYASAHAVAGYVESYLFDVLSDVGDDNYIAQYLKNKGYKVEKP